MHKTFDSMFWQMCKDIRSNYVKVSPRGSESFEIMDAHYVLHNPKSRLLTIKERKFSINYLKEEVLWYISRSPKAIEIGNHASLWHRIADDFSCVNSNYGQYAFDPRQYNWVIESLKRDKDSRQAIINFNQPQHKYVGNKDFVCTISAQFLIRENKLHMIVNARSNDVIYGICYDVPFFTLLQEMFLVELRRTYPELQLGEYHHNSGSLHCYLDHWSKLVAIANSPEPKEDAEKQMMPAVDEQFLADVKAGSAASELMKWLAKGTSQDNPLLTNDKKWFPNFLKQESGQNEIQD